MTTYTLPLSPAYVSNWGVAEACRELIQNALDKASPRRLGRLPKARRRAMSDYPRNSEGLRIFRNGSLAYSKHPRLVDAIRDKLKVVIEGESKRVVYTDPIFKGSPFTLNQWFDTELTDEEVLANHAVQAELCERFGYRRVTHWSIA